MKTVPISKLSNLSMVAGYEKKISKVIHYGVVKEWVGCGWIDLRKATARDKKNIPTAVEDDET